MNSKKSQICVAASQQASQSLRLNEFVKSQMRLQSVCVTMEAMPDVVRNFHVLTKPVGPICNLDCKYCFYLEKEKLYPGETQWRMSDEVLTEYVRQYIQDQTSPEIYFAWQGGEPTLLGVDFFRKAVALQNKFANGKTIFNAIQTNGTLLDDDWCRFLAANKFLVGLSIDGPRELHDIYRVDKRQQPTFDQVMRGLECLKKHKVDFNTLTVVNRANSQQPLEVYRFLKSIGSEFLQFIPLVERSAGGDGPGGLRGRLPHQRNAAGDVIPSPNDNPHIAEHEPPPHPDPLPRGGEGEVSSMRRLSMGGFESGPDGSRGRSPHQHQQSATDSLKSRGLDFAEPPLTGETGSSSIVTPWSVEAEQYGNFLCAIFDEWVRQDVGKTFVQLFDVALGNWMGLGSSLCVFAEKCGTAVAIEHNGDLYSCDHYVYPRWKLGNVMEQSLGAMVNSPGQAKFGNDKSDSLPQFCRKCEVRFACNGECPKHRFIQTPEGEWGLNYLCAGYKKFFNHIDPHMKTMAKLLRNNEAPARIMEMG
ncbi:MAG TPA: anaerobic sulfatase maturase [Verrucomicrobiae bacterium]|jgi:anaerobic sulfatase-maturating enzyme